MQWLSYSSPCELICNSFLHVCVCVRVRANVCVRQRACVSLPGKFSRNLCCSQEISGKWRSGRGVFGDFGCSCVLDACCPLPTRAHFTSWWSHVYACVAARMFLHVHRYYLYWWVQWLLPCHVAVGMLGLFAGAVMKVAVSEKTN